MQIRRYWEGFFFALILAVLIIAGQEALPLQAAGSVSAEYGADGWHYEDGKFYWFIFGELQTGLQEIEGETYYFSPETGQMLTGWVTIGKKTYYFSTEDGRMLTGRQEIENSMYYLDPDTGLRTSGWVKAGKKTYYAGGKGVLKEGWVRLDGKKYYFSTENNNMQTGWTNVDGKYYYLTPSGKEKGVLQKNCIAGTKKTGCFYVDGKGIRVTSSEIVHAVEFVQKYAAGAATRAEKLRTCYQALQSYQYRAYLGVPSAGNMSACANDMFTRKQGNCYRYAASFACVARVLGYESRVGVGGVSSRGPGTRLNPHGWAEVKVNDLWSMCDISMQRHYPSANLYLCAAENYPFRFACNARYTLTVKNGKVSWN